MTTDRRHDRIYYAALVLGTWFCAGLVALALAGCGGGGGGRAPAAPTDVDSVLTIRNVDPDGLAIAWVDVEDATGYVYRSDPALLTFPGEGEDSELRVHQMAPGTYAVTVQWKSAGGAFIDDDGVRVEDPVTFTWTGEDIDLEVAWGLR